MRFSIVTPSFRSGTWLGCCIASVADQEGVEVEHIVQDAGSDDGTLDWLLSDQRVRAFVEKDQGMYDAVNRGWRRSSGEILAYLNCDEQYLPGALQRVQEFFERHPGVEVVLADSIVVDVDGKYICHRMSLRPWWWHMWYRFPVMSCGIFFRRCLLEKRGLYFDTRWRDLGDYFWVLAMLEQHVPMAVMRGFTCAFTDTGANMNLTPNARRESAEKTRMSPRWVQWLRPVIINQHRLRCLINGCYFHAPYAYAIYTLNSRDRRQHFQVDRPTGVWTARRRLAVAAASSTAPP